MSGHGLSPLGSFVRQHDPDRFLCALFAPAEKREALFALVAYNHELARAREAASNPMIALIRLQWWREVVENAAAGKPPRQHEVAQPLHGFIGTGALAPEDLLAMADAREAEAEESIPTTAAFQAYLRGSAGGLALAAGRLLDATGPTLPALQQVGALYGLAGVLRSTGILARQGRCLLPEDALGTAGLNPHAVVAEPASAGPVLATLATAGLEHRPDLAALPRRAVAAALPLVLARRDLRRLAKGQEISVTRSLGDRLAVMAAGLLGRV
jgi:15-cis-phytoene synthase